ncbi:hypothetical protein RJ639_020721 [Escallonia herrerae]|uniref:pyridoxal kinase n=1 Tax=Escallonia herrerae TaxID=1293975 RepID=A0AA88V4W1_9ASTE|nr:hypothetical protein RJ639_020721 [Escallonia herrerae]
MLRTPLITGPESKAFRGFSIFRVRSSRELVVMAPPILSLALPSETGRVLSIQSHTVQGYVGNKSAVFPLQLLGYDVDPINSVQIYWLRFISGDFCDPVMGDEGKLYVPPELVSVYREKVVPVASMLTPNQFEAEQLTGFRIVSEQDGREACNIIHAAGPTKVVITSINIDNNLFLIGSHQKGKGQSSSQFRIVIPKIPAYFTVCSSVSF